MDRCLGRGAGESRYSYGVAVAAVLAATAVRLTLLPTLGSDLPFLTFFPAVMLAVLYGGWGGGLAGTVLSGLGAGYFLIAHPGYDWHDWNTWAAMAFFLGSCVLMCAITVAMQKAQRRLAAVEAQAAMAGELLQAAKALQAKDAELEVLLNHTPFMFVRCTRDLRYRFVSRAYAEMAGRAGRRVCGTAAVGRRRSGGDGNDPAICGARAGRRDSAV